MVPLSGVEECWPPGLTLGGGGVCVRLCLFQGSRPDGARPPHSSAPGSGHGSQSSLPVCGGRGRLDAASTLSQMLSRRWDAQLVRPPAWGLHHPPPRVPSGSRTPALPAFDEPGYKEKEGGSSARIFSFPLVRCVPWTVFHVLAVRSVYVCVMQTQCLIILK